MTARRVRPRRVFITVKMLTEIDPGFRALDAALLGMGWARTKVSPLRRRRDGALSGRVVWRKGERSAVWASTFSGGCRGG